MNKKKGKNLLIVSFVILSISICSVIWKYIDLNFSNITQATGAITQQNYSTDADTVRYVIFIIIPLITFLISYYFLKSSKTKGLMELIKFPELKQIKSYTIFYPLILIITFIIIQFFSLNLPVGPIDTFHDGELFSVTKNTILRGSFFKDTYTIHGFSDIFYPLFFWKIIGSETIGAGRLFFFFLNLLIKFLCLILSYQLIKFSLVKNKTIFFVIFSLILLSFSGYQVPINFSLFSYRDIYIIIFLIFFSNIFISNNFKFITNCIIGLIPPLTLIMHIDTGVFLFVLKFSLIIFFIINKKFEDVFFIFLGTLISSLILFIFFGSEELISFFNNAMTIILSMDYLHGTKYPEPFFSIGENKNGMRATRGLLLQLTAGLFVLYHLISKKNNISNGGKIFFLFLFFLSFIMYKNALGRSDSYHIRMSNDLPILINSFFIINFFLLKIESKFSLQSISNNKIIVMTFIILSIIFFNKINFDKIKNYKKEVKVLINLPDEHFIDDNRNKFIKNYKILSANDSCFQNFTDDLILLYLMNKKSCTKFIASWLASPSHLQEEYIKSLKASKPEFIVYNSIYFAVDSIHMSERLEKVNKFIIENYHFYKNINNYEILRINN
tara:strand:- start:2575 stop:4410 length:1836 start_codon:yes stop_codon:yes gene_type:complete